LFARQIMLDSDYSKQL